MKHFKIILLAVAAICISDNVLARTPKQKCDREYWTELAYRMAQPVLENMACGKLQKNMQTEFAPSFDSHNRKVIYMEAFGRLMAGIAPWVSLPDDDSSEGRQRHQLREWALASYKNAWGGQAFPKDRRWADDIVTKDKYFKFRKR